MTRSLRQYLQHPDQLFRRVRDRHGLLQLSRAAQEFHPGTGVYRSSYKNARRLAATETNIAYRTSDHLRWQQMDFVVGIEIQLSNNHTVLLQPGERTSDPSQQRRDGSPKANAVRPLTDICDTLAGRYPKDFKFTGWHPHCRCRAISILKTDEELAADTERMLRGQEPTNASVNTVRDVPAAFRQWLTDNADRISRAQQRATLPLFLKDNQQLINDIMRIETNRKEYERLKADPNYKDVEFNPKNGGLKATHIQHNFNKNKGWYETSVLEIGYANGEVVILEKEVHSVLFLKNTEGSWNYRKFELAAAENGESQNIRNALKHCVSKPDAQIAVIYLLNELSDKAIQAGLQRFNGLKNDPKQWRRFKEIIFILPSGQIKKHFPK